MRSRCRIRQNDSVHTPQYAVVADVLVGYTLVVFSGVVVLAVKNIKSAVCVMFSCSVILAMLCRIYHIIYHIISFISNL